MRALCALNARQLASQLLQFASLIKDCWATADVAIRRMILASRYRTCSRAPLITSPAGCRRLSRRELLLTRSLVWIFFAVGDRTAAKVAGLPTVRFTACPIDRQVARKEGPGLVEGVEP